VGDEPRDVAVAERVRAFRAAPGSRRGDRGSARCAARRPLIGLGGERAWTRRTALQRGRSGQYLLTAWRCVP